MRSRHLAGLALVGIVVLVIAVSATTQGQQRVQSTTQLTVEAMKVAAELAQSGSPKHAARLENDLEALDQALREYVRASERLRHKDRAVTVTMEFLALQNNIQMQSRQYQTISNALTAAHQVESAQVRNLK